MKLIYDYRPKRKSKTALFLTALLLLVSATALALAWSQIALYKNLLIFVGALTLEISVLVAGRYLLKDYSYAVMDTDESLDFVVFERKGKKQSVVCRVALDGCCALFESYGECSTYLKDTPFRRYDYCIEIGAKDARVLLIRDDDHYAAVRFMPNDRMTVLLQTFARRENCDGDASEVHE